MRKVTVGAARRTSVGTGEGSESFQTRGSRSEDESFRSGGEGQRRPGIRVHGVERTVNVGTYPRDTFKLST
ncbi:hypothetical protein DY000_02018998 [Brassica cretica]|uniref:Uncharacterized protein n=1 Tax=Brassica cretica TaxID=69181 RepID=A0ABQ7D5R0_BRACR|nr:hypothetical protein DY000_02018998 [Brassica cretica]